MRTIIAKEPDKRIVDIFRSNPGILFTFLPILSGLSSVSILDSTQLRNSANDPIEILTERNGLIEVN